MATIVPQTEDPTNNDVEGGPMSVGGERKGRSGRHSRFTAQEGLIITREVAASAAHVAAYGQIRSLFENCAVRCNAIEEMTVKLTWKQVQDRYTRLQTMFDKEDGLTYLRSGIGGGQLSKLNELLSQMREARDDVRSRRTAEKYKVAKDEEEKERIGRDLVAASLSRKNKLKKGYRSDEESEEEDSSTPSKQSRKKLRTSGMSGELAAFDERLRDSDLARIAFEREQLALKPERFAAERAEKEQDRRDRVAEREAAQKLELEKLKVMMEAFSKRGN